MAKCMLSVMYNRLFDQCWPGIFVQCRLNLKNVGEAFAMQQLVIIKITGPKQKFPKSDHMLFRQLCTGFFPVQYCIEHLEQHCIGF